MQVGKAVAVSVGAAVTVGTPCSPSDDSCSPAQVQVGDALADAESVAEAEAVVVSVGLEVTDAVALSVEEEDVLPVGDVLVDAGVVSVEDADVVTAAGATAA